jgi:hypothetical protein
MYNFDNQNYINNYSPKEGEYISYNRINKFFIILKIMGIIVNYKIYYN